MATQYEEHREHAKPWAFIVAPHSHKCSGGTGMSHGSSANEEMDGDSSEGSCLRSHQGHTGSW